MVSGLTQKFFLPAATLWQREIVRFYRQKSRVIGALVPPVIFWFLIGSGLGGSFRHEPGAYASAGVNYLQYFYPGTVVMIVLFTAIFSTISVIEDRREGFLQSVLAAPVSRSSIALGKILGGATLSFLQGMAFLLLAPAMGVPFSVPSALVTAAMLFLIAFGLTGLGFLIAWKMDSSQGFHAVMNLFLMPMWFLSGALFPLESAPDWLRWTMMLNPLTYGLSFLRYGLYARDWDGIHAFPSPLLCVAVTLVFGLAMFFASVWACSRREIR